MKLISFKNPIKQKMASGNYSLELTDAGSWESFPTFAKEFISQLGGKITNKFDGPDARVWEFTYQDQTLRLVYNDFPNGISIEPMNNKNQSIIDSLYDLLINQKDEKGL